jgi:ketosteroid isomerase-like protein
VIAGDVALLYTNFTGASRDANGELEQLDEKAVEVLRRQADGSWRLIIGDPLGRRR